MSTTTEEDTATTDIACGSGYALARADRLGADTAGIDASDELIAIARTRTPDADLVAGDMFDLPWADATFDVATSFNGIWGGFTDALREAHRILGGLHDRNRPLLTSAGPVSARRHPLAEEVVHLVGQTVGELDREVVRSARQDVQLGVGDGVGHGLDRFGREKPVGGATHDEGRDLQLSQARPRVVATHRPDGAHVDRPVEPGELVRQIGEGVQVGAGREHPDRPERLGRSAG